jgi:hypothetical protein
MDEKDIWDSAIETVSRNEHLPEDKFKEEEWDKVKALFEILKNSKEK